MLLVLNQCSCVCDVSEKTQQSKGLRAKMPRAPRASPGAACNYAFQPYSSGSQNSNRNGIPHRKWNMVPCENTCSSCARPKSRMPLWPAFSTTHIWSATTMLSANSNLGGWKRVPALLVAGCFEANQPPLLGVVLAALLDRGTCLYVLRTMASTCAFQKSWTQAPHPGKQCGPHKSHPSLPSQLGGNRRLAPLLYMCHEVRIDNNICTGSLQTNHHGPLLPQGEASEGVSAHLQACYQRRSYQTGPTQTLRLVILLLPSLYPTIIRVAH
jgi:hypothetical protein